MTPREPEMSAPQPPVGPHILAIDDDPAMRNLVASYLGENGVRVTAVATGTEMAQVLAQRAINLVVLDLRLSAEDGMDLARKLRESSAVPIIIVTGKQEEADRVMGLELGADDYVTKPFSPRELLARIRAVLRRYETVREVLPPRSEKRRAYRFAGWELNLGSRRLTLFVEVLNLLGRENVRAGSPGVNPRTFEVFELFQTMIPRVPSAGLLIEF